MDRNVYVSWALSDFDIDGPTYDSMDMSELDSLIDQQINLNHTTDRGQLAISKNVLLSNKVPVKSFSSNPKTKKAKRVSFTDLSSNGIR
jgi:PKD repeat protein